MADIQDFWTWFKAVKPEWFTAAAAVVAAVAAVVAAVAVVLRLFRRYVLRRELRGSGAAIIALLGEPQHEARMDSKGRGELGWIKYTSEVVYIRVGTDYYLLCSRDLDRLHSLGYVHRDGHERHLSSLGRQLLQTSENAGILTKGMARAKRATHRSCLRCYGGLWLRCRCEKFWLAVGKGVPLPFSLGRLWAILCLRRVVLGYQRRSVD